MEYFYAQAFSNVYGLKIVRLLRVGFAFLIVVIVGGWLWYVIVQYRRRKKLLQETSKILEQANAFSQQMLVQKIRESEGKIQLVLYIEYLERFTTNESYHGVAELLWQHGWDDAEVENIVAVLYKNAVLDDKLKEKIFLSLN